MDQQQGWYRRRFGRQVVGPDTLDRPTIGQHPGHAGQQRPPLEQIALSLVRWVLGIAQVQLRLDPLVMGQLELPGLVGIGALQVIDERLGDLGEQRCLAAVTGIEIPDPGMPADIAQRLAHHRETAGQ